MGRVKIISQRFVSCSIVAALKVSRQGSADFQCAARWLMEAIKADSKGIKDDLFAPTVFACELSNPKYSSEASSGMCATKMHRWCISREETPEEYTFIVKRLEYAYD